MPKKNIHTLSKNTLLLQPVICIISHFNCNTEGDAQRHCQKKKVKIWILTLFPDKNEYREVTLNVYYSTH